MTYRLTPEQARAIGAANTCCRENGMPEYIVLLLALAGLATAVRDGKPTRAALDKAVAVVEQFRNDSAERPRGV
jgi:hypothetical protein